MRFGKCVAENFGSYSHLEWDFRDAGLALVYGPTGSGKSTFEDLPCWVLFGRTAKEGAADDIKKWDAKGPTTASLEVDNITIVRTRAPGQNDLYWTEEGSTAEIRGKDLVDTQKRLDALLGVSFDLYLTSAYFSEFSDVASFFTAKAKDRRELVDKIVSMEFPTKLALSTASQKKDIKALQKTYQTEFDKATGRLDITTTSLASCVKNIANWNNKHKQELDILTSQVAHFDEVKANKIEELEHKSAKWEEDKYANIEIEMAATEKLETQVKPTTYYTKEIKQLTADLAAAKKERCETCGGPANSDKADCISNNLQTIKMQEQKNKQDIFKLDSHKQTLARLVDLANPVLSEIAALSSNKGPGDLLEALNKEVNPFLGQQSNFLFDLEEAKIQVSTAAKNLKEGEASLSSLDQLSDIIAKFRGERLEGAVQAIQDSTNDYLETYFDAEIRVCFTLQGSDSLEVSLFKDGHPCGYKQLSKGQRALLKLCFSLTIMHAVANKAGIHFSSIFLDEALDGLDKDLKVKSFRLLQSLSLQHESVYVIDHAPELQERFERRYRVSLTEEGSVVTCEE
jgi:DNA repair exonuclease SbcCD ATPase subunit